MLAAVARWFGGVKLGKGGLARAYAAAVREALADLPVVRRVPTVTLDLDLPYDRLGAVQRLLHPPEIDLASARYGERVHLSLTVHADRLASLQSLLADLGLVVEKPAPDAVARGSA